MNWVGWIVPVSRFICRMGTTIFSEGGNTQTASPENVTVFEKEVTTEMLTTKTGERVAITGFSYPSRWVEERMIVEYPNRNHSVDYHIGMPHGFLEGLNSSEGVYAPFSLGELNAKNYDYWALGHIHKRQQPQTAPVTVVYYG